MTLTVSDYNEYRLKKNMGEESYKDMVSNCELFVTTMQQLRSIFGVPVYEYHEINGIDNLHSIFNYKVSTDLVWKISCSVKPHRLFWLYVEVGPQWREDSREDFYRKSAVEEIDDEETCLVTILEHVKKCVEHFSKSQKIEAELAYQRARRLDVLALQIGRELET